MGLHRTEHRVRFHELDPYGHVNHAMYVTYFEIGRVDALAAVDLELSALAERGYQFVVTRLEVRFRQAATAGDTLVISTGVSEVRRASTGWTQEIRRGSERVTTASVTAAITDTEGRPVRPPAWIFERLDSLRVEAGS